MITFTIPGTPRPWQAPRACVRGGKIGHYKPRDESQWKDTVAFHAISAGVKESYSEGPVSIMVLVIYPRPATWPKTKRLAREPKTSRPDGDNLLKAIKDSLQGLAVKDDAQFWCEHIVRMYGSIGEPAHVDVALEFNRDIP